MTGRAANLRTTGAAPGRAAIAARGLGRARADRQRREAGRAADDDTAQRIAPGHLPGDPLGDRPDPFIQASPASARHLASSPLAEAGARLPAALDAGLSPSGLRPGLRLAGMVARAASGAGSRHDRAKARTSAVRMTDPAARTTPPASTATSSGVPVTR